MFSKKTHILAALGLMAIASMSHAIDAVESDKLIRANTTTKQFTTSISVQTLTTDVKEGVEIYQRKDGSCYELTRKITGIHSTTSTITGVELQHPETSNSIKEVDCGVDNFNE